jgi:tetratricopeptide (TPR) repeat protein
VTEIFPPIDLLQQTAKIELGLRKNMRLREWGWVGIAVGTLQFLAVLVNTDAWRLISDPERLADLKKNWLPMLSAVVLGASVVAFLRFRSWIGESKAPFRYTCSIADFEVVPPPPEDASFRIAPRMRYDLAERLNERVARLTFLDEKFVSGDGQDGDRSHIHVGGDVLIRRRSDNAWYVEVTPRIRMGGAKSSERLAHSVKFTIAHSRRRGEKVTIMSRRGESNSSIEPPPLEASDYEKILERVYFSIATEIYRQIRRDVERKISLLPTPRLKAIAYLYEAEDYLKSNTLDAYEEAKELFDASLRLFVRKRLWLPRPSPDGSMSEVKPTSSVRKVKRGSSRVWARRGRRKVLVSRAEIGYASTLIYRRALAGMSGHRINAIFEARPLLELALTRLERLSYEIPGTKSVLFDGHVTNTLLSHYLNSSQEAHLALERARSVDPARATRDPAFLFAAGLMEIRPRQALPFLRLAVEEDPRFEVAQFELALKTEHTWRARPELETSIAEKIVADEYMEVLKIDPGNVRAWTNLGYVYWLLGDHGLEAEDALLRGREYKEIRRTTYVAELDHSLARLSAESNDFESAYKYYLSAVSAHIAQGVDHQSQTSAQFYFFDFIGDAMLRRYVEFKDKVVQLADQRIAEHDARVTRRMCDSVAAFALNDCGEAYRDYYSRTGDPKALELAWTLFRQARDRNTQYVMPHFNLYLLETHQLVRGEKRTSIIEKHTGKAIDHLDKVLALEPRWPDAVLAGVFTRLRAAQRAGEGFGLMTREAVDEQTRAKKSIRRLGWSSSKDSAEMTVGHVNEPEEQELRTTVLKEASKATETREIRRLTPHDWLWQDETTFNWTALSGPPAWQGRWEREIDDLNVRALFSFGAGLYLRKRVGDGHKDGSRAPGASDRHLHRLLLTIRDRFWPADFWLLRLCREIPGSGVTNAQFRDIIETWLKEDPSAYWALGLVLQEQRTDEKGAAIESLFPRDDKIQYLRKAVAQDGLSGVLYEWLGEQLAGLNDQESATEAYERAVGAYNRAACASKDPEHLVALGKKLECLGARERAVAAYRRALVHSRDANVSALEQAVRGMIRVAAGKRTLKGFPTSNRPEDEVRWRTAAVRRFMELEAREGLRRTVRKWLELEGQLISNPVAVDDQQAALRELELKGSVPKLVSAESSSV